MTRAIWAAMAAALLTMTQVLVAAAEPTHGISVIGEPALGEAFSHLPQVNPDAPRGGRFAIGASGANGGFDSLNPYILKGRAPWEIRAHSVESLMGRNWDEPFSLYGLLAEAIETPPDRSWVEFTLRDEARFSDGAPVTPEDVAWSMEQVARHGRPGFRNTWKQVQGVETGERSIRFTLTGGNRETPMILGLAPILKKAQFEGRDFGDPSLEPLIATGPYMVAEAEPGRFLSLRRNPDYWGRDLPFMRGQNNVDEIRVEYFADAEAQKAALRAGEIDFWRDLGAVRLRDDELGDDLVAESIPHSRPTGMYGLTFNTRRAPFDDIRVRQALAQAFDFDWVAKTLFDGRRARIEGYFANSPLGHQGAAEGREREILAPFADTLPEGALEARWTPPKSAGDGRNRAGLRRASRLLSEAGFTLDQGVLRGPDGAPFAFEILLVSSSEERAAGVFRDALARLGIAATIRSVDSAQYQERRNLYDYDMIVARWGLSLSPGAEQRLYWGRAGVSEPGSRNYMGVDSPAAEAAIDAMLAADTAGEHRAAVRALDRVLSHGVYVIPYWFEPESRIVHAKRLKHPDRIPLYGDWIGWAPELWWSAP